MWFVYILGHMFTFSDCLRVEIGRDATGFVGVAITDLSEITLLYSYSME